MTDTETPEVTARVEETWAAMEVDGETQTIRADSEEEVRSELLRRTVQIAAEAGSDVHLVTTDRDGEWRIVVSPDGDISETGEPSHAHGAHNATGEIPVVNEPAATGSTAVTSTVDASPAVASTTDDEPSAATFYTGWSTGPVTISPPPMSPATAAIATTEAPDAAEPTGRPTAAALDAAATPAGVGSDEGDGGAEDGDESEHADETDGIDDAITSETPRAVSTAPVAAAPVLSVPAASAPVSAAAIAGPPDPISTPAPRQAPAPPVPLSAPLAQANAMPTLADFRANQPVPEAGPAERGWRGALRRGTGGLVNPKPGAAELRHRDAIASVSRSLTGPRTICVVNPKGGAHKTTATMLIAATFGLRRGGYTLAWDNNETRGTLGWRAHQAGHTNTAVDLLADMERFADPKSARVGDLDNYVRTQADAQFDVLASDEDAAASSEIDGAGFNRLHEMLQRFYRIIVVDTGNNMRASNWEAAVAAADQLVIVSAMREDTAGSAAWMVEGLARKGHEDKLRSAVTVLSAPDKMVDAALRTRLVDHFGSLTRAVVEVPYDPALVSGAGITMGAIAPATREAWLLATAKIAEGL